MTRRRIPTTLAGTLAAQYPELAKGIAPEAQRQMTYLSRFAEEIAEAQSKGEPMSEVQIAARSILYGGAGRAVHFAAREVLAGVGFIAAYEAIDDKGTCTPCLEAEEGSPYLPNSGPYPGKACKGRGRCRCRRVIRYDPETYERLTT